MNKLRIRAGKQAYQKIKQHGFNPSMISAVVAAAGGPKWFTTYGLVRYIIGDLLSDVDQHIHFVGSSVGSWQMTAALTSDPVASLDKLQKIYCHSQYTTTPTAKEISSACKQFIIETIGDDIDYLLGNKKRSLHVISSRGKGLIGSRFKAVSGLGFAGSFILNLIKRKWLDYAVERVVFSTTEELPYNTEQDLLKSHQVQLGPSNLIQALQASGSIPFVMEGVKDVPQAPNGTYWDGGMTDYHISLPYDVEGIVLHPHFLQDVTLGWYDKRFPQKRRASSDFMSKVLLVTPSENYVHSLPRKQISDMKDFKFYDQDQSKRSAYWQEISDRSIELGEEFRKLVDSGSLGEMMEPYSEVDN